jgi:hypothetical protein
MSTKQTGNEQNVVNLGVLITRIASFSSGYNPSRPEFSLSSLTELKTNGESIIATFTAAENVYKRSVATRKNLLSDFDPLITRIINFLRASGAIEQTIVQAKSIVRELRGIKTVDKAADGDSPSDNVNGTSVKQSNMHYKTFDRRLDNFNKLIQFLSTVLEYNPNETDLKIDALITKYNLLKTTNDDYNTNQAALDATRLERDAILYTNDSGLVAIAKGVKLYVKSAFGATSPQYKSISEIVFSKSK